MSQSERPNAKQDESLTGAIRQLEALLDAQSGHEEHETEQLPILDEVVDPDAIEAWGIEDTAENSPAAQADESSLAAAPDAEKIRTALDRVARQMETELDNVVSTLRSNMLQEFRNELAAALNMDPKTLERDTSQKQDNQVS